ncbi:MAG TPA: hypothetical protein VN697_00015, partial [Tepidiformaceae bacterium]|nr:hypothetical protein [Tepidiformaceae bacterium]
LDRRGRDVELRCPGAEVTECGGDDDDSHGLGQQHTHRLKRASEWIEHEAEIFQRHRTKKRLIARFAREDRLMARPLGQREVALRDITVNGRPVGEDRGGGTGRLQL